MGVWRGGPGGSSLTLNDRLLADASPPAREGGPALAPGRSVFILWDLTASRILGVYSTGELGAEAARGLDSCCLREFVLDAADAPPLEPRADEPAPAPVDAHIPEPPGGADVRASD